MQPPPKTTDRNRNELRFMLDHRETIDVPGEYWLDACGETVPPAFATPDIYAHHIVRTEPREAVMARVPRIVAQLLADGGPAWLADDDPDVAFDARTGYVAVYGPALDTFDPPLPKPAPSDADDDDDWQAITIARPSHPPPSSPPTLRLADGSELDTPSAREHSLLARVVELIEEWTRHEEDAALAVVAAAERVDDRGDTLASVALASGAMLEMIGIALGDARKAAERRDARAVVALLRTVEIVMPSPRVWLAGKISGAPPWARCLSQITVVCTSLEAELGMHGGGLRR